MATIKVSGMRCGHCSASVTKALEALDGIDEVQVDLASGEVSYSETKPVSLSTIKDAISKIGFEVAG